MKVSNKVLCLRIIHGLISVYFILCLIYLYYAAFTGRYDVLLAVSMISLGLEGILVFVLNNGNCPLIHIQKKIGDDTPFFEVFFPKAFAKRAIPVFALLTWIALGLLLIGLIV